MKKFINDMKRANIAESGNISTSSNLINSNNNIHANNNDNHKYDADNYCNSNNNAGDLFQSSMLQIMTTKREELNASEKNYLIAAERGDLATVKSFLEQANTNHTNEKINISCIDPLGRSALLIAIEYENLEMIELLLNHHVQIGEALLHAINEEFVEAVEILLQYQDQDAINSMEVRLYHDQKFTYLKKVCALDRNQIISRGILTNFLFKKKTASFFLNVNFCTKNYKELIISCFI